MDILNALTVLINFTVIPALAYGSQLALGAIFVTLIYAVLRFANFATGDMMSFGTMFAVLLTYYFQTIGINFGFLPTALLTIPFAIIAMIIYMLLIDKFVFSYYRIKKSPPVQFAMVSVGVMFVTQAIIRIVIGPSDRRFIDGEKFILKANEFKEITGLNEGITLKSSQAILIGLDKITAKSSELVVNLNENKTFGPLEIKVLKCGKVKVNNKIDSVAYMQVKDLTKNENEQVFIFNGWTFASDPTLTPFDHAIYDLQLLNCNSA